MSELKCPFCQQELQETFGIIKQFWCSNYYNHTPPINLQGTKELWQELIRTRKALDVAVDALKRIKVRGEHSKYECCKVSGIIAQDALDKIKKITAREQKD